MLIRKILRLYIIRLKYVYDVLILLAKNFATKFFAMVKLLVYICLSIEETENPQWDTIAISDFDIINSEIAVGYIFNLPK